MPRFFRRLASGDPLGEMAWFWLLAKWPLTPSVRHLDAPSRRVRGLPGAAKSWRLKEPVVSEAAAHQLFALGSLGHFSLRRTVAIGYFAGGTDAAGDPFTPEKSTAPCSASRIGFGTISAAAACSKCVSFTSAGFEKS